MLKKLHSKNNILISLICLIGIVIYVLIVFSFDSIEEVQYLDKYNLIVPIFFIGILASGIYSIDYFRNRIEFRLNFGLTRKECFIRYLKTISLLLILLMIFVFVYLCTIVIYLMVKEISFEIVYNFIIKLIEKEMFIDVLSYFILCNGIAGLLSNKKYFKNEFILVIIYCLIVSLLFVLNIFLGFLNGNIIYNILIFVIGIILLYFNYLIVMKKNY